MVGVFRERLSVFTLVNGFMGGVEGRKWSPRLSIVPGSCAYGLELTIRELALMIFCT